MKMDKVAGSGNDEFYTPEYAVAPIMKYIKKQGATIWCPLDTEKSLFVKMFREAGYNVIATHIQNGDDFFQIDVPRCDYIISNPPYSMKSKVFNRLFEMLDYWVSQNVALIKTIPQEPLSGMREIVYEGYRNGRTTTAILKEIQRTYSTNKKHARLIARDQMAKLNADLTKRQQTDAGVEEYKWSDSRDARVRPRHKHLNGKTFRWDDPPVVDTKTGRRCHPGQDYQCRCVAIPVFNISTLNIQANPKK